MAIGGLSVAVFISANLRPSADKFLLCVLRVSVVILEMGTLVLSPA
jgi:hypothetical protein